MPGSYAVDSHRLPLELRAQRLDEGLTDTPDSGRLTGATGEHHLNGGARVGPGRRDGTPGSR